MAYIRQQRPDSGRGLSKKSLNPFKLLAPRLVAVPRCLKSLKTGEREGTLEFRFWGLGSRVEGFGLRVQGLGFEV
jgi:hypothetical protein